MKHVLRARTVAYFSVPTVVLIAVSSIVGLTSGNVYDRETAAWLAQAFGQDIVNLVLIVPVIVVSALFIRAGKRIALLVWLGAMMYTAYTFAIYSFGVHFNSLFLVYCWTLGLSVYAFITVMVQTGPQLIKSWFDESRHEYAVSIVVLVMGVLFYLMWLKEDLPAMINDVPPASLAAVGLLTNPVHVLDYSLILPCFILTSVLLVRKHALGYIFAPVLLVFGTLMDVTIAVLVVIMKLNGISNDLTVTWLFIVIILVNLYILTGFFRHMKKREV